MSPPEEARFLSLLQEHRSILYKVAFGYCRDRDDRSDLVQEMAIQLWRSYGRYDGRVKFTTWAYRVAMNVAISHFRGEKRRIRDTLPFDEVWPMRSPPPTPWTAKRATTCACCAG